MQKSGSQKSNSQDSGTNGSRQKITRFRGQEFYLSNFYLADIEYKGRIYPTVEHAYQAAKTTNQVHKERIRKMKTGGEAKRAGRELKDLGIQREDWYEVNIDIMRTLLKIKFSRKDLRRRLIDTGDAKLIEGNTWGDRFFGMHKDEDGILRGQNILGKLLMELREELK